MTRSDVFLFVFVNVKGLVPESTTECFSEIIKGAFLCLFFFFFCFGVLSFHPNCLIFIQGLMRHFCHAEQPIITVFAFL